MVSANFERRRCPLNDPGFDGLILPQAFDQTLGYFRLAFYIGFRVTHKHGDRCFELAFRHSLQLRQITAKLDDDPAHDESSANIVAGFQIGFGERQSLEPRIERPRVLGKLDGEKAGAGRLRIRPDISDKATLGLVDAQAIIR